MKSYPQIYAKVYEQPWLITPAKHRAIRNALERRLDGGSDGESMPTESEENCPQIMMDGTTAIIPINGIIGKHLSMLETMCGGCDVDAIAMMIDEAVQDSNCERILFNISSPGGTVTGVPELGRKMANCPKPTIAFTDTLCCSAALWLASQCNHFYCTESSDVGSVGVYSVYLDESRALDKEGVTVNAITAGKYKMTGASFRPMTDDERKMLQAGVDKIYTQFKEAVTRNRVISEEDMQGQCFDGQEAVEKGFCDGLVEDITDILDA
jgi:signal peptide peptidase SppA